MTLVAPYVGAWIETRRCQKKHQELNQSHPTWVRGLKHNQKKYMTCQYSRTLRGCVD